jgi:putative phosphoesterase
LPPVSLYSCSADGFFRGQSGPHSRFKMSNCMKIGVVSDTHGLFRPEVALALAGVERILHLGDVGKSSVLKALGKIAPVMAVRGNVDREGFCAELPETDVALIAERYVYMLHDLNTLHLDPAAGRFAAVLSGHTHVPNFYRRKGVLYFNPGSCGPRRFRLPVTVGLLTVSGDREFEARIIELDCG